MKKFLKLPQNATLILIEICDSPTVTDKTLSFYVFYFLCFVNVFFSLEFSRHLHCEEFRASYQHSVRVVYLATVLSGSLLSTTVASSRLIRTWSRVEYTSSMVYCVIMTLFI